MKVCSYKHHPLRTRPIRLFVVTNKSSGEPCLFVATLCAVKPRPSVLALDTGWCRGIEKALSTAQRARKKDRVRVLHAKAANRRKDAIAKFSKACSERYGFIFVGNVSSQSQIASGRAKGALDAGWGLLRTQLRNKCHEAGAVFVEVNEAYSTQTCSCCHQRTGPKGVAGLGIREWTCSECGSHHGRDGNAARNILEAGHGLLAGGILRLWAEEDVKNTLPSSCSERTK